MLRAHLHRLKRNDTAFRVALLDETLFNFHRYFFVMPILSQFELEVYRRAEQNQPLTDRVLNGGAEAADRYLRFLHAGSSVSPTAAFELAGVDMTTPEPVEKAFAALSVHIDRLAEVAG